MFRLALPSPLGGGPLVAAGRRLLLASVALAFAACGRGEASTNGPWHADLAEARAATAASQRPVLAIFVASWSEESRRIVAGLRSNAEAVALVTACFEPVLIDVDSQPELTRRLQIVHLPSAVVLGADDRPMASFECPADGPAFVAAAARASREATVQAAATGTLGSPAGDSRGREAERGSISMLTGRAGQDGPTDSSAGGSASYPSDLQKSFAADRPPPQDPSLPTSPPAWTAERPAAPLSMAPPTPGRRMPIEPPAGQPQAVPPRTTTANSWLSSAPRAAPETAASVTDMPGAAVTPPATTAPPATGFWAGFRNPFAGLVGKPAAPAARPEAQPTPTRPQGPAGLAAAPAAPAAQAAAADAGTMPLGLEGYCPVTLVQKQAWSEGRPQYGVRHRGRTYLFAGPAEQQTFLADPDRYAPALSGDDPVLALEQGRSLPGQRRYGVFCQSRMYLFASPETRDAFSAHPDKFTGRVAMAEQTATPAAAARTY